MTFRLVPHDSAMTVCALLIGGGMLAAGCGRNANAFTPQQLQEQYGIADAYTGQVQTADGAIAGTLVPVTLPDGRRAQLIIPAQRTNEPHAMYYQDDQGLHPVALQSNVTRDQLVSASSPAVVERRAEPAHARRRSWEKEMVIIGGSAGAGAAVGALAKGKKGAGIGAAAGGVGGLIYDLATRKK